MWQVCTLGEWGSETNGSDTTVHSMLLVWFSFLFRPSPLRLLSVAWNYWNSSCAVTHVLKKLLHQRCSLCVWHVWTSGTCWENNRITPKEVFSLKMLVLFWLLAAWPREEHRLKNNYPGMSYASRRPAMSLDMKSLYIPDLPKLFLL